MPDEILHFRLRDIRGADANSLLRFYDGAIRVRNFSTSQQERARAYKAVMRLTNEMRKRKIRF